jgi:hypothetical protein
MVWITWEGKRGSARRRFAIYGKYCLARLLDFARNRWSLTSRVWGPGLKPTLTESPNSQIAKGPECGLADGL